MPLRLLFSIALLVAPALAQRPPDITLDAKTNREVVEGVLGVVNAYYVSVEGARRVDEGIRRRMRDGAYDKITSAYDLMDALDADLQALSNDKHLAVAYNHRASPVVGDEARRVETPAEREEGRRAARAANYGFEQVERLPGNVGYLRLGSFVDPDFAGEMAGKVMSFLAGTDALILDLRTCQGGSADMVHFLASYFFEGGEPTHLGDWYVRAEGRTQQWWTLPYVPGERYAGKPVYILVSARTFSAPEGLTAILQHHKRATVVGEATRGGTHPGKMIKVHANFAVFVPTSWFSYPTGEPRNVLGRPVYPTTRTDTAGTGITPDIAVPADQALDRAKAEALRSRS